MIPSYPDACELTLELRPKLHPRFQNLPDGVSEFTFANLYLFRRDHHYRISSLPGDLVVITGRDGSRPFFMLPFGLPERTLVGIIAICVEPPIEFGRLLFGQGRGFGEFILHIGKYTGCVSDISS